MDSICIQGGIALQGKVHIQGSKNAALPILAATLLLGEKSCINNCPRISDVHSMVSLLKGLNCEVCWHEGGIVVDSANACCGKLPRDAVTAMRSSIFLLGALIGRCNQVELEYPGGCVIGSRPIDLHIKALRQMGVVFEEKAGHLRAKTEKLHGAEICLPFPSVGVTENVILAGVMAEGNTLLSGAAREPEVTALCEYLCCCGAVIEGIGSNRLKIHGGRRLYGTEFRVPSDRIVAGTYLFACVGAGGCVLLEGAPKEDMCATLKLAEEMGAGIFCSGQGIYVQAPARPAPVAISTAPHPGFPTDLQSTVLAVSAIADGESIIEEKIFENRFRILEDLRKMGACMELVDERSVRVQGVKTLKGACVEAKELRGGAALVVAGLMARGNTRVDNCRYIYRGYENICRDFRELGARIISV